jgi:hypothetical protein
LNFEQTSIKVRGRILGTITSDVLAPLQSSSEDDV